MSVTIGRRELIAALGGAAAWPLAVRAQQPAMPVIGFLSSRALEESEHLVAAFRRGLAEGGFVEGQNVEIECRFAAIVSGATEEERQCAKLRSRRYCLHSESLPSSRRARTQ
jgi:hypothetical protein